MDVSRRIWKWDGHAKRTYLVDILYSEPESALAESDHSVIVTPNWA